MPPIEAVAGESAGAATPGGAEGVDYSDIGAGPMEGDSPFALPETFQDNIDDIDIEPLPASGATPPPAAPATPPAQPTAQPAATPPQATPAQSPAAAPAQTPVAPDAGAGRVFSPSELAQQLGQNRDTIINALAAQKFALSPADVSALEVDAVGVLPRIMARVYFEATVNGLQQLANMVPRMVEHVANERIAESNAEMDFHTEWPNIDKNNPEHMRAVVQLSTSFRQMNPRASMADAIKYVGMAATQFLGLQMPARGGNGSGRPAVAAAPRRPTSPPFAPANGGRAQPPAGFVPPAENPFAGLGHQFDE